MANIKSEARSPDHALDGLMGGTIELTNGVSAFTKKSKGIASVASSVVGVYQVTLDDVYDWMAIDTTLELTGNDPTDFVATVSGVDLSNKTFNVVVSQITTGNRVDIGSDNYVHISLTGSTSAY